MKQLTKQRQKTLVITAGAALTIVLALLFNGGSTDRPGPPGPGKPAGNAVSAAKPSGARQQKPAGQQTALAEVGVVNVVSSSHQARVKGYGEVAPRYHLQLSAQVTGRIEHLSDHFETGARFKQGEVLATIDRSEYQEAVDSAEARYQEARVALEEERLQAVQAKDEWQRSGLEGEPASSLVLREPQLAAAQAGLKETQSALERARRDLGYTRITSPFNSIVVSRSVQPGSFVQSGAQIATLYSTQVAEIAIPLAAGQWHNLPSPGSLNTEPWLVTLTDMDGLNQWRGEVERIEQHVDSTSRQRSAVVVVKAPLEQLQPLYFGTYVVATIMGKTWDQVWQIPSSAISQQQEVWYVQADKSLNKFTPQVLFQDADVAYIQPVPGMREASIVARPLSSYLVGMLVNPVAELISYQEPVSREELVSHE